MIENANYCYKVIPFELKNARATYYQRLMNKVFTNPIERFMEVYVEDMVAKTIGDGDHYKDLQEICSQMRKFNMYLNPNKCVFGVRGENSLKFCLPTKELR